MKNLTNFVWYSFFSMLILINASSCKKDAVNHRDDQESYTIGFKFKEFDQAIRPMGSTFSSANFSLRSAANAASGESSEEFIYYWSFNAENLTPEIAAGPDWKVLYNKSLQPDVYASGWAFEDYEAGKAISMTAVTNFVVVMPLNGVKKLHSLDFDIGSSGTGPKNFSISYSQDGTNYTVLVESNQFSNTNTAQGKNSFSYPLDAISFDYTKPLYIKLIPKAGNRGTAPDYRETTGVTKVDNIRLTGEKGTSTGTSLQRLHYHVFDASTKSLVLSGAQDFTGNALTDFSLQLPAGEYIASFAANISQAALLIPESKNAGEYYLANPFSNYTAKVFGVLDTFTVAKDTQMELTLKRYYSEIKFEFTDAGDLSNVAKMVVSRKHEPEFYAPFNTSLANPISDESKITLTPDFSGDTKEIVFNQFIGSVVDPVPLAYTVDVFDSAGTLLRTFDVEASIRNNIQLVFRGGLLESSGPTPKFVIRINEEWDGSQVVDYGN